MCIATYTLGATKVNAFNRVFTLVVVIKSVTSFLLVQKPGPFDSWHVLDGSRGTIPDFTVLNYIYLCLGTRVV